MVIANAILKFCDLEGVIVANVPRFHGAQAVQCIGTWAAPVISAT
jgi:hypothetical protein